MVKGSAPLAARVTPGDRVNPEERIHRRVVAELRRSFGRWGYAKGDEPLFHAANESMVPARYRAKLAALGVSRGVPDVIVVHPVCVDGTVYPGLALELKSAKGSPSAAQLRWLGYWQAAGFYAVVLRGGAHAAQVLQSAGLLDHEQAERVRTA